MELMFKFEIEFELSCVDSAWNVKIAKKKLRV